VSNTSNSSSSGIGAAGLLGIVFVVLKLTGHVPWSWWWVTLPFWGGSALVFFIVGCLVAWAIIKHYAHKGL